VEVPPDFLIVNPKADGCLERICIIIKSQDRALIDIEKLRNELQECVTHAFPFGDRIDPADDLRKTSSVFWNGIHIELPTVSRLLSHIVQLWWPIIIEMKSRA
jgi:hypothetical protein